MSKTTPSDMAHVALVTGATGLVGRYLVQHLLKLGTWKVYAVSRAAHLDLEGLKDGEDANLHLVQVASLLDKKLVSYGLKDLADVTHIYHCAFHTSKDDQYLDIATNLKMLSYVVEAIEEVQQTEGAPSEGGASPGLQHVYVQLGSKYYGQHLGKYKTPARETDPRYMTPNFYYDLMDYCIGRVESGAAWSWSALLPNPVIGYSPASFMNLLNAIAGYAVICRQLGLPFRFPGSDEAYEALTECCDVQLLAEAIEFVSTTPAAANKIFNVSNGDVFRWSEVWPDIAKLVGLEAAPPQAISLTQLMVMPDKQRAWKMALDSSSLASKPEAAAHNYERLISWDFADFCFGKGYDYFQSVTKLRQVGFTGMKLDTTDMWLAWFKHLDALQLFPPVTAAASQAAPAANQPAPAPATQATKGGDRAKAAVEAPAGDLPVGGAMQQAAA